MDSLRYPAVKSVSHWCTEIVSNVGERESSSMPPVLPVCALVLLLWRFAIRRYESVGG